MIIDTKVLTDFLTVSALAVLAIACVWLVYILRRGEADDSQEDPPPPKMNTAPTCYGDYPFGRGSVEIDRECMWCIYHRDCRACTRREIGS